MTVTLTKEQIGLRLSAARRTKFLTVREAAQRVGVSHATLVRYENGENLPPLDVLVRLANLYDVTPAAFYAQEDDVVPLISMIDQAGPTVAALQPAFQQMLSLLRTGSTR